MWKKCPKHFIQIPGCLLMNSKVLHILQVLCAFVRRYCFRAKWARMIIMIIHVFHTKKPRHWADIAAERISYSADFGDWRSMQGCFLVWRERLCAQPSLWKPSSIRRGDNCWTAEESIAAPFHHPTHRAIRPKKTWNRKWFWGEEIIPPHAYKDTIALHIPYSTQSVQDLIKLKVAWKRNLWELWIFQNHICNLLISQE